MHLSPVYEWGYESSGMSWDLSHIRICHKRSCISWSTGQPKHGWCWEMPGIRRWHEQSQWILGPLHKLLIVPRPEDMDGPIRVMMRRCVRWNDGLVMAREHHEVQWHQEDVLGNHEAYQLQHVCSLCAGNLPAIQTELFLKMLRFRGLSRKCLTHFSTSSKIALQCSSKHSSLSFSFFFEALWTFGLGDWSIMKLQWGPSIGNILEIQWNTHNDNISLCGCGKSFLRDFS